MSGLIECFDKNLVSRSPVPDLKMPSTGPDIGYRWKWVPVPGSTKDDCLFAWCAIKESSVISFADQFGELRPGEVRYRKPTESYCVSFDGCGPANVGEPYTKPVEVYWVGVDHSRTDVPAMAPPAGLVWDWRQASDGGFAWQLAPAGDGLDPQRMAQLTAALRQIKEDLGFSMAEQHVAWVGVDMHNPLAAMCHHKDTHSTERLPESTAKEAPQGICAVAGFDHRPGAWK